MGGAEDPWRSRGAAFVWREDGGLIHLAPGSQAWDISLDGLVVAGDSFDGPFRWTEEGGMQTFTDLDASPLTVSGDGSLVGGRLWLTEDSRAFVWNEAIGARRLDGILTSFRH